MNKRSSGILIHPTSFPGPYGCGDLGDGAKKVIDWLKRSGQSILQVLPLGPTSFGDSPYQALSAFAGTPYIISFDILIEKGYLKRSDLDDYPKFDPSIVDYGAIYRNKFGILKKAFNNFKKNKSNNSYISFCNENKYWLDDYALFMSIKDKRGGQSWNHWEDEFRKRRDLEKNFNEFSDQVEFYKFIQWEFYEEWQEFRRYASHNGISIIGDIPIFVSYDSSDVWENQQLFRLDEEELPEIVAGVPPDYFSDSGQLWGNPIYKWENMKENDFEWWKQRIAHLLKFVDCIRIDHFRGFDAYWEIEYGEKTAVNGKWVKVPGYELFNSLKNIYGKALPEIIIAEDLGVITEEVKELRDAFALPGMRIFEFADFPSEKKDDNESIDKYAEDAYLPENYVENCIAYPGTHDNNTLNGWFHTLPSEKQKDILNYMGLENDRDFNYNVIISLMRSKADRVIFMIQDILGLSGENRMNTPGTCDGKNWSWRVLEEMLTDDTAERLFKLTEETGRL